jgi:hypothetical protein
MMISFNDLMMLPHRPGNLFLDKKANDPLPCPLVLVMFRNCNVAPAGNTSAFSDTSQSMREFTETPHQRQSRSELAENRVADPSAHPPASLEHILDRNRQSPIGTLLGGTVVAFPIRPRESRISDDAITARFPKRAPLPCTFDGSRAA